MSRFSKKEPELRAALKISLQLKRILSIFKAFSVVFLVAIFVLSEDLLQINNIFYQYKIQSIVK
jgi:hypothetical protein